jgi:hypothetical protein
MIIHADIIQQDMVLSRQKGTECKASISETQTSLVFG